MIDKMAQRKRRLAEAMSGDGYSGHSVPEQQLFDAAGKLIKVVKRDARH